MKWILVLLLFAACEDVDRDEWDTDLEEYMTDYDVDSDAVEVDTVEYSGMICNTWREESDTGGKTVLDCP